MLELGLEGQVDVFQMRNPKTASQVDHNMCSNWREWAKPGSNGRHRLFQSETRKKLKESSARSGGKGVRRKTRGFKDSRRRAKETRCLQLASEPRLSLQPSWNLTGKRGSITLSVCQCIVSGPKKFQAPIALRSTDLRNKHLISPTGYQEFTTAGSAKTA